MYMALDIRSHVMEQGSKRPSHGVDTENQMNKDISGGEPQCRRLHLIMDFLS